LKFSARHLFKQPRLAVSILICICSLPTAAQDFKVTLLGTGAPKPTFERFGPATLVEVGGQKLLFDAGRGVAMRLYQINVPLSALDAVFLTHFHHDHLVGLPDIWMTGWLPPPFGQRSTPFEVWGPTGTAAMMKNLEAAFSINSSTRIADELLPPAGIEVVAHEFEVEGVVYEKDGVKVTAFDVDHGDLIKPSYGYRIDYDDRSVVISGDTQYNENLIAAAEGADLILHEVVLASEELIASSPHLKRIVGHHTTPEQAGIVFSRIGPKLAVFTHLTAPNSRTIAATSETDLIPRTRSNYDGPLVVGEDLMSFLVGDTITVVRDPR
jgi:ribonuclease Z